MARPFKYTMAERADIMSRALQGEDYGSIAKSYGTTKNAIAGIIFRLRNPRDTLKAGRCVHSYLPPTPFRA